MGSYPALFQKSLLLYIERVLTIEGEDGFLKNFFLLLEKVFADMVKPVSRQSKSHFKFAYQTRNR